MVVFQTQEAKQTTGDKQTSSLSTKICFMGYACQTKLEERGTLYWWCKYISVCVCCGCMCVSWTAEWSLCSPLLDDETPSLPVIVSTLLKVTVPALMHQYILFCHIVNRHFDIKRKFECHFITFSRDCTEMNKKFQFHPFIFSSRTVRSIFFQQILASFSSWNVIVLY